MRNPGFVFDSENDVEAVPINPESVWWKGVVIYQIYPRSFKDSDGDGVGDLRGITERLDYLRWLGVDGLWLSPIYPSPMHDFGYDVSDYTSISPEFGTMKDFDTLLYEAHGRGIRILMDLVLNHTSSEHPWFVEASSSRQNPKRDWFIWHDGKPGDPPRAPNNWMAAFGGRAWQWEPKTRQFYLHSFLKEQPDVNWHNPELREAMGDVMRFWLERGVDGFRLDVVNWFIKDEHLRDNPTLLRLARAYDRQEHLYDRNRPETVEVMRYIRSVVDEYPGRTTVGEVYAEPPGAPELAATYYDNGEGLHTVFNFDFLYREWSAAEFAASVGRWEALLGPELQPVYTLGNHDQPRALSRYGGKTREESLARARVAAAMLLTLRGKPYLYYGEEIGMQNGRVPRRRMQDPLGKKYWPFHRGRDPYRTPMQWSASENAGFTGGEPWLPVNPDHGEVNVEVQREDSDSLLHWYRELIQLRKQHPALHSGSYHRLHGPDDEHVFGYLREYGQGCVAVALNFSGSEREVRLPGEGRWEVLLGSHRAREEKLESKAFRLEGYEALIVRPYC